MVVRRFRAPALDEFELEPIRAAAEECGIRADVMMSELCYNLGTVGRLTRRDRQIVDYLFRETYDPDGYGSTSFLSGCPAVVEIGPRLAFESPDSTIRADYFRECGVTSIERAEATLRLGFPRRVSKRRLQAFARGQMDPMVQAFYPEPIKTFDTGIIPEPVKIIPLIEEGMPALEKANAELGLGMDDQDRVFILWFFVEFFGKNPTDVALFMIAQFLSEHCRHQWFTGTHYVDGKKELRTLLEVVKRAWLASPGEAGLAFCDDSSTTLGAFIRDLLPRLPGKTSDFKLVRRFLHLTIEIETHCHPTRIYAYAGAATGPGGDIRDGRAVGQGGKSLIGIAGYHTANLELGRPWERGSRWKQRQPELMTALQVALDGSRGVADYGNCFGRPTIIGVCREVELTINGQRWGYRKPILLAGGAGVIDDLHLIKGKPKKRMLVVQVGGPAFDIGVGGAGASSMISGQSKAELDYKSVQRPQPEMERRIEGVFDACIAMGKRTPIVKPQDLGAGGDCVAIPELVLPEGARIELREIPLGDRTITVLVYWCNESQERYVFLIWPDRYKEFKTFCIRERVPCKVVGEVTGDGRLVVHDSETDTDPIDLPMQELLERMPRKTYHHKRVPIRTRPLRFPIDLSVRGALGLIVQTTQGGSKDWLTSIKDATVGGRTVVQQNIGRGNVALSDYGIYALSHFTKVGSVVSMGEQPLVGLVSPEVMGRRSAAEAFTNMAGALISGFESSHLQLNWMWPAKEPGEAPHMFDTGKAVDRWIRRLITRITGGKDSLTLVDVIISPSGKMHRCKAPRTIVITAQSRMDDVRIHATADLKQAGSTLLFIDLSDGSNALGGSLLAQVHNQVGDKCPDVCSARKFGSAFLAVQDLLRQDLIRSIHDRSDGGLILALCEMAFAGYLGVDIDLKSRKHNALEVLFSEGPGLIIETGEPEEVVEALKAARVPVKKLGAVTAGEEPRVNIRFNGESVVDEPTLKLRAEWEGTSIRLDQQPKRSNPKCVRQRAEVVFSTIRTPLEAMQLTFRPKPTPQSLLSLPNEAKIPAAVLRAPGSNGHDEMHAAAWLAGLNPIDYHMSDIAEGRASLDDVRIVLPVGGFSYKDVDGAGKMWSGITQFNDRALEEFRRFYERPDTLSFGPCNACQHLSLLGWAPLPGLPDEFKPRFLRNELGRFRRDFVAVRILDSPSIPFTGMAGSILGVHVAHGEGRFLVPREEDMQLILAQGLAPGRYVDPYGAPTEIYPWNPNGSPYGIAFVCDPTGRHTIGMPHPERGFLPWQSPWLPPNLRGLKVGLWLHFFQNLRIWCEDTQPLAIAA